MGNNRRHERHVKKYHGQASKVRVVERDPFSHYQSNGAPKVSFLTESGALTAAERLESRETVRIYKCAACGFLHLGN
jgi:hypothetical protein